MSHILLLPFGSAGDVFPFIWLGKMLKARGHRVTMVTACLFADVAEKAGLDFIPLGTEEEFESFAADRRIWKLGIGSKVVMDYAVNLSGRYLKAMESVDSVDLMMAPLTSFGARMAREKHGVPLITVHLQPLVFLSAYDTPLLHPVFSWFRALPVPLKRLVLSLPNPINFLSLPGLRKVCRANDVNPPETLWPEWWDSPDGVLALFPEWFAKPQPDWPENLLQWDFPMEDLSAEVEVPQELRVFLAAGEKPVVFTPGSANVQAERFFETAVEVVRRLGIRAVFVTRMPLAIPDDIGGRALKIDFVPFAKLLPDASVFVHHGGVGTMAQAFRAGVPQLIMAMAHDQPDNADRVEKSGVGIALNPKTFTPERVSAEIVRLTGDPGFQDAATKLKGAMGGARDSKGLLDWIERRMAQG
ncbi:MAG: glycosyltransferase [Luteolibacter sp.]